MEKRAIQLNPLDNVAVCTKAVAAGDTVTVTQGDAVIEKLDAVSDIAFCNKIALISLAAGDLITKYGETIGKATTAIQKGALVNDANIVGIARAYQDEYIKENSK